MTDELTKVRLDRRKGEEIEAFQEALEELVEAYMTSELYYAEIVGVLDVMKDFVKEAWRDA